MKNLFAIFLMAVLFVSCDGEVGPMGPPGKDGSATQWVIENDIEVRSSDWKLSDDEYGEPMFTYDFRIKDKYYDIYIDAYENGLVSSYMYLDHGDKNLEAQTPLPNIVNRIDKDNNLWTETYSYDYSIDGFIIFKVKVSDFITDQRPPTTYFRVALTF